jgi:hypothetical protein
MGLKQTALAIGIAIVFTAFIAYGLWVVYEPPEWYYPDTDECYKEYDCSKAFDYCWEGGRRPNSTYPPNPELPEIDRCTRSIEEGPEYQQCIKDFQKCRDDIRKTTPRYKHARNSFFILFIIALAAIITGIYLRMESISSGFIAGGVFIMIWSLFYTAEYWLQWNKYVKLAALGIVLVILIYLGWKKIETKVGYRAGYRRVSRRKRK